MGKLLMKQSSMPESYNANLKMSKSQFMHSSEMPNQNLNYPILPSQISLRIANSVGGLTIEEAALLTQGDVDLAMKVVTLPNAVLEILWTG